MRQEYRRAERMLYDYPRTLRRWQDLMLEIHDVRQESDVKAQSYDEHYTSDGWISDPASDYVNRLINLEHRAESLQKKIEIIEGIKANLKASSEELDAVKYIVMERIYFEHESMYNLSQELGMTDRKLYRCRELLVHNVIDEMHKKLRKKVRNLV